MRTYQHAKKQNVAQSSKQLTLPTVAPQPPQVQQQSIKAKSNEEGLAEHAERLRKFQRLGNSMIQMGPPRLETDKTSSLQSKLWIQKKLTLGEPGDKYEQEADRVASQVVQQINAPVSKENNLRQSIQRKKDLEEEMQARCFRAALQRKQAIASGEASPDLESAINSARSSGQPLDAGLQQSMGQAMGADFSGVRVHTDAQSDQLNQSIQARAFTMGQDVFFRSGTYQPGKREGQELIAHELTHVVQQIGKQDPAMQTMVQRATTALQYNPARILEDTVDVPISGLHDREALTGTEKKIAAYLSGFDGSVEAIAYILGHGNTVCKHYVPYKNIADSIIAHFVMEAGNNGLDAAVQWLNGLHRPQKNLKVGWNNLKTKGQQWTTSTKGAWNIPIKVGAIPSQNLASGPLQNGHETYLEGAVNIAIHDVIKNLANSPENLYYSVKSTGDNQGNSVDVPQTHNKDVMKIKPLKNRLECYRNWLKLKVNNIL